MICLRNKQLKLELRRLKSFLKKPTEKNAQTIERFEGIKSEMKKHLETARAKGEAKVQEEDEDGRADKKWKSEKRREKNIKNLHKLAIVILI